MQANYFSITYLFGLLPLAVLAYALVPQRMRGAVLLCLSYAFYWRASNKLIGCLIVSTVCIYLCGLGMEAAQKARNEKLAASGADKRAVRAECKRRMRPILVAGILVNVGILFALKYLGFFSDIVGVLASPFGLDVAHVSLAIGIPMGISFYTLSAISYLVDVYRETIQAEHNIARLALFLSFFPQIMEGPICRYEQTAHALWAGEPLTAQNMYRGSLRILFGIAKKLIVADRLNLFIKLVFNDYTPYDGGVIALAAVAYTVQLYCDFSGTMDVAIGTATLFSVPLPENFRQPFFSLTASEFWQRWHITLGTWFKDYVYYPISLSKPAKSLTSAARKKLGVRYGPLLASSVALFAVWLGNGIWHGAGTQYLLFGMYYFVAILGGGLIEPAAQSFCEAHGIDRESLPYRIFRRVRTLAIVFAGELLFRANDAATGLSMLGRVLSDFRLDAIFQGELLALGVDVADFAIVVLFCIGLLLIGLARERGEEPSDALMSRPVALRLGVWILLVLLIVVFGAYGGIYEPVDPMYAKF